MPLIKSTIKNYEYAIVDDFHYFDDLLNDNTFAIIDQHVYELYSHLPFFQSLNSKNILFCTVSEQEKQFQRTGEMISQLISMGIKRNSHLLAIGGGVIQDITCFISQILFRGIDWSFVPTTFLAQADSCIGSKSSINLGSAKNQVGGFYPPSRILINPLFLNTLSGNDYFSGVGEVAHYFLLNSFRSFQFFSHCLDQLLSRDQQTIRDAITASLEIKRQMIEVDEFDKGPRLIFNYGHSFGHAIEASSNYAIPHGVAVAYGMLIANNFSFALSRLTENDNQSMKTVLQKIICAFGPVDFPASDAIISTLLMDKKNKPGYFGLVLATAIGDVKLDYFDIESTSSIISSAIADSLV